jgi:hypothetical protein
MRIAVVGDLHGHWLKLRECLVRIHDETPLDLVLQVGDAQATRDELDLSFMPVPERHRSLGDFNRLDESWPIPTWFIGGNHEPFNRLESMPQGGTVLPNLDYMGRISSRTIGGMRIAGVSGIFSSRFYESSRDPWPFHVSKTKQASYFRRKELQQLAGTPSPDILLIHEWPTQMEAARTAMWPNHWAKVGSEPLGDLISRLRPRFVFCGHMHVAARVEWQGTTIVALDNFAARPDQSIAILESDERGLRLLPIL